jgi:hypothetical protein
MYKTIKIAQEIGMNKDDVIHAISEHTLVNDITMISKPGFTKKEASKIYDDVLKYDEDHIFSQIQDTKFHQIMGSFYTFLMNPTFILGVLEKNQSLKDTLMKRIKKAFCLPEDYNDWDNLKSLLIDNNKWLYLDVFTFCSNCPESLYRRGMLNLPYIRNKVYDTKDIDAIVPDQCHANAVNDKGNLLVKANSWYVVKDDTFFAKILKSYDRAYISGPSGSAVLAYIFVFTFLDFKPSFENKIKLLSCIIGDYIPYYHSLTEILMTYTFEIDQQYDLSIDPVTFAKKLIKPILDNLKSQDKDDKTIGGKNKTKK